MTSLLTIGLLGATFVSWYQVLRPLSKDAATTALATATWLATYLWAVTETCSALGVLTPRSVFTGWGIAVAIGVSASILAKRPAAISPRRFQLAPEFRTPLLLCVLVHVLIALTALASAPNSTDGLSYHLPRVEHWIQQGSVAPFTTSEIREVAMPPFAEYLILHLRLMSESDRLSFLPQWLGLLGTSIAVALVAKELGGRLRGSMIAGLMCLTTPLAVLQSSGADNDLVASSFFAVFVLFGLRMLSGSAAERAADALLGGIALGLALYTKGTIYPFALPFLAYFTVALTLRQRIRAVAPLACMALATGALVAPYWIRIVQIGVDPSGHSESLTNRPISLAATFSNSVRNLATQLQTPFLASNDALVAAVGAVHGGLSLDAVDPRTTFAPTKAFLLPKSRFHESLAGNAPQVALFLIACVATLASNDSRRSRQAMVLAAIGAGFLVFSAVFKWQVVGSNLLLPLVLLGCSISGNVIAGIGSRTAASALVCAVVIYALPYGLFNSRRPLLGERSVLKSSRAAELFVGRSEALGELERAVETLVGSGCTEVGLQLPDDAPEYPAWVLLRETNAPFRMRHLDVENATSALGSENLGSCATLRMLSGGEAIVVLDR